MKISESTWAKEDKLFQQFANILPMNVFVLTKYFNINILSLMIGYGEAKLSLKQSISSLQLFL